MFQNEILISFAVDSTRAEFLPWAKEFVRMGYTFVGTPGTAEYYSNRGVSSARASAYMLAVLKNNDMWIATTIFHLEKHVAVGFFDV